MENSQKEYKLSIIIPYYNTPVSLCRLLDSIGRKDYTQIIVIDDHSDKNLEIFAECKDRFSYVQFLKNDTGKKGAGAARNTGLRCAKGKWLLFADSDDEFLPGWFETISGYMDSDFDLVFFSPCSKKEDQTSSDRHVRYAEMIDNYLVGRYRGEERLRYCFVVPWSKLIRTSVVMDNKITFDEVLYSNDVMFSTKTGYYAGKMTADRRQIYCVTERKGSLTYNNSGEVYCRRMRILCEQQQYLYNRLDMEKMNACGRMSLLYSIKDAVQKGYDLKTVWTLCRIFREYKIPVIIINYRKHIYRLSSLIRHKNH